MPKFLDVHPLKGVDEETLRKAQKMPKDEFGITHDNMMYNKEEDKWYCPLDAPKEAVEKHHQKAGITRMDYRSKNNSLKKDTTKPISENTKAVTMNNFFLVNNI